MFNGVKKLFKESALILCALIFHFTPFDHRITDFSFTADLYGQSYHYTFSGFILENL